MAIYIDSVFHNMILTVDPDLNVGLEYVIFDSYTTVDHV